MTVEKLREEVERLSNETRNRKRFIARPEFDAIQSQLTNLRSTHDTDRFQYDQLARECDRLKEELSSALKAAERLDAACLEKEDEALECRRALDSYRTQSKAHDESMSMMLSSREREMDLLRREIDRVTAERERERESRRESRSRSMLFDPPGLTSNAELSRNNQVISPRPARHATTTSFSFTPKE
jgi:chromosome segregation ATPase